jgi:hypothetical protein
LNFRKLIEQAMNEARDEFAAIVARKLAALMGDAGASSKPPRAATPGRRGRPAAAAPSRKGGRQRAPADHMAALRDKVLSTMRSSGEPMKKSQIVKSARLPEGETPRVGQVLKRLKDEGLLSMKGQKGAAVYTLRGRRKEAEPEPASGG